MIEDIDAVLAEHDQTTADRCAAFLADAMAGLIGPLAWDPVEDAGAIRRLGEHDARGPRAGTGRPSGRGWTGPPGPKHPNPWSSVGVTDPVADVVKWTAVIRHYHEAQALLVALSRAIQDNGVTFLDDPIVDPPGYDQ